MLGVRLIAVLFHTLLRLYTKARLFLPAFVLDPVSHRFIPLNSSNFLHLFGSLGDQYYVISLLGSLVSNSSNPIRILAHTYLYPTLRLFYSRRWINQNVVFFSSLDYNYVLALCQRYSLPYSRLPLQTSYDSSFLRLWSPFISSDSSIRRSVCIGSTSYTTALTSFLHLQSPFYVCPPKPCITINRPLAKSLQNLTPSRKSVLYFPVNHTHLCLTYAELRKIVSLCQDCHIDLFFNISGASTTLSSFCRSISYVVQPKHHEIPFVASRFCTIAGVAGGGLCVAEATTHATSLILVTPYTNNTWEDIDPDTVTSDKLSRIHLFNIQLTRTPKDRSKTHFYLDHASSSLLPTKNEFIQDIISKTI